MESLSQDATMFKEELCFDKHSKLIVGIADDIFNEKGIDLELKGIVKKYENDTENTSNEEIDEASTTYETSTTI